MVIAAAAVLSVLVVEWLFGDTLVAFTSDLLRGLDALPSWIVNAVVLGTRVLWVIVLGGLLWWTLHRRQWRMLATVAAAAVVAALLVTLLDGLIETDSGQALVDIGIDVSPLTKRGFPSTAGIAAVSGVLTAAAPWLGRRWRRAGWTLIAGLMVTGFVDSPVSFDSTLAVLVGWLSGAAVLVVVGAPSRRPTLQAVIDGLNKVGVPVQQLEQAGVDARGSTPYFGVDADGGKLFVKALGTDERSADVLFRLYRRLQHRNFGDERPFRTLRRAVEHEAFVALVAQSLGVRTPSVRGFATAHPNGFVLAYDTIDGRSLDRVEPNEVTDEVLAAIWRLVGELRRHRIAHRDLRLANVFLDDSGDVWLIDFGFSEVAASDLLLATDVAELLASSSLCVGAERATANATRHVEPGTLAQALDRLQLWALSGATRTAIKRRPGLLDALRSQLGVAIADTRVAATER
jgi:glycosyltransferase 2 family protein